jgi:hypothetical protein
VQIGQLFCYRDPPTVLDFEDAAIGDGDLEDVGGEVFDAGLRGRDGLGVNVLVECLHLTRTTQFRIFGFD